MIRVLSLVLILTLFSCANYSRQAIDKLSGRDGVIKIAVVKPSVDMYEVDAVGSPMLKAEWTRDALKNVQDSVLKFFKEKQIDVEFYFTDLTEDQKQYLKLQDAVSGIIIGHVVVPEMKLPTKDKKLDWTLGPEIRTAFNDVNADYLLILGIKDHFSSAGRILAQTIRLLLIGSVSILQQQGWVTLVDLNNGDVVWFDFVQSGSFGDTRKLKGADEAVKKILKNLPNS